MVFCDSNESRHESSDRIFEAKIQGNNRATDGNRMPDSQIACSDAGHIYFENRKTLPRSSRPSNV